MEAEPPPPLCDGTGNGKAEDSEQRASAPLSPPHPERAVRAGGRLRGKQGTVVAGPAAAEATASATPGGCRLPRFGEVLHSANGSPLGTFAARGGITPLCRGSLSDLCIPAQTLTLQTRGHMHRMRERQLCGCLIDKLSMGNKLTTRDIASISSRQFKSIARRDCHRPTNEIAGGGRGGCSSCGSLPGVAVELDCDGNVITLSCPEDGQQLPERLRGLAVDRLRSLQSHLTLLMANMEVAETGKSAGAPGCVKVEPR
eukprot:SM000009S23639  [mRNA]  locus=s9:1267297:1269046:+ [translate_table: standard]